MISVLESMFRLCPSNLSQITVVYSNIKSAVICIVLIVRKWKPHWYGLYRSIITARGSYCYLRWQVQIFTLNLQGMGVLEYNFTQSYSSPNQLVLDWSSSEKNFTINLLLLTSLYCDKHLAFYIKALQEISPYKISYHTGFIFQVSLDSLFFLL